MTQVVLSPDEYLRAGRVGFRRHATAVSNGLTPRFASPGSKRATWQDEAESAGAELAVALLLGLPWTGEHWLWSPGDRVPPPDVGDAVEVKWTANERAARLRFHPGRDEEERFYFLVTGRTPTYDVVGWLRGRDAALVGDEKRYPERTIYEVRPELLRAVEPVRAAA